MSTPDLDRWRDDLEEIREAINRLHAHDPHSSAPASMATLATCRIESDIAWLVGVAKAAQTLVLGMTELKSLPGASGTIDQDAVDALRAALTSPEAQT